MNSINNIRKFNIVPYLIIFYFVGLAGLIIPQTKALFVFLVPFNLLLNLLLLMIYHGRINLDFAWKAGLIFSAGFIVEIIGVNTGIVFGSYEYGPTLGLKFLHTPVIIGANWLMLVYGSLYISSHFTESRYFRSVIAAVLMVAYDFVLEPAAIDLEMWNWGGAVPIQNYLAWLFVSLGLIYFADASNLVNKQNKIAAPLFYVQLLFFIALNIWMILR